MSDQSVPSTTGQVGDLLELFRETMAALASGVAVVAARRSDGKPCGLTATSVSSYSAEPPSVLVSVAHSSRCHGALVEARHFGVHILGADQEAVAREFAGKGEDKFADVDWSWSADVPQIGGTLAFLRCRRSATFERYDHSILIGDLIDGRLDAGEPLVYLGRRMDRLLRSEG